MGRLAVVLTLVIGGAACDNKPKALPDAPPLPDAAEVDAADIDAAPPDAAPPDAMPDPPVFGQELTSTGGRASSASYVIDVQVGHGTAQTRAQSSSYRIEGNAPIKP
jgi:hypothetical protein